MLCRLLMLPGWRGSEPSHWQSIWQQRHGCEFVQQSDFEWPRRGDWMARLDEAVQQTSEPVVLIAHSLGCHLVAAWANHSCHAGRVQAALLVAPPDVDRDDMPPQLAGWRPAVRTRLPFTSLAVISTDDPYGAASVTAALALDWGSATVVLGAHGHINSNSGLGDWPQGWALLQGLLDRSNPLDDHRQSTAW